MKPDVKSVERWLGDAKYKRLPAGGCHNADLSAPAYSITLDLLEGTLVYAADEGVVSVEHIVVECGKPSRVVALDFDCSRAQILQQIGASER
jgi:hypothetical protein